MEGSGHEELLDDGEGAGAEGAAAAAAGAEEAAAAAADTDESAGAGAAPPGRIVLVLGVGFVVLFLAWTIRQTYYAVFPSF